MADNNDQEECDICGGDGYLDVRKEDSDFQEEKERWGRIGSLYTEKKKCICLQREQFREWVGKPIYEAERLDESPLLGKENENLFITAQRPDMLAHMRYVLAHHDMTYYWRMTTDSELRDIFVGNSEKFDSITAFAEGPELFVIQLAVLSYENKAMSGVVLETIRTRQFEGKATWIVNPYDEPFKEGHLSYSEELDYFITENFEEIELPKRYEGPRIGTDADSDKKRPDIQDDLEL